MAKRNEPTEVVEGQAPDIQHIKKRLDLLDQRLDNMDSMVSAIAERVLSQLVTINITCPHCGKHVEISVVGSPKRGQPR